MPRKDNQPPKSLEEDCGWISSIFMLYLDRLFAKGSEKSLETSDLGNISQRDKTGELHKKFVVNYEECVQDGKQLTSLWYPLLKTAGFGSFALGIFMYFLSAVLGFGPVLLLNRLVKHFDGETHESTLAVWVMVALLFVFPMSSSVCLAHSNSITSHIGCQCRNILVDVIYRKALVISPFTKLTQSTGRIITMFSADTKMIGGFFFFVASAVIAPFQIAVCLYLIYQQVGTATFVGIGYTLVSMALTAFTLGIVNKWRLQKMTFTDLRVKLTVEVLAGVRVIKYYGWENPIINKINEIRLDELKLLSIMGYLHESIYAILMVGAPQLQVVLLFTTYIFLGNDLDVATAFTTMTLFNIMTMPFVMLPIGLQAYMQCQVAMKRIHQFILSDELAGYVRQEELEEGVDIHFEGANLCWTPLEEQGRREEQLLGAELQSEEAVGDSQQQLLKGQKENDTNFNKTLNTLVDLNIKIKTGQLVGIVGTVGCGKSSILSAILGEMHLKSGTVSVRGDTTIAYCDQRPFVVNDTLKNNILFHTKFDEERFNKVIDVVCLKDDVRLLSHGVMTEIGERGITLSGGQKARVSLARAVYSDADIYLLDDPLSAVDAHVGEHLFSSCIKEYLHGKTRLLVTHHVRVLPDCDLIIILDDSGRVVVTGSYEEILQSGINIEKYLVTKEDTSEEKDSTESVSEAEDTVSLYRSRARTESHQSYTSESAVGVDIEMTKDASNDGHNLMTKEEQNEGAVEFDTYWQYMHYGGVKFFIWGLILQLIAQGSQLVSSLWLIHWGQTTTTDYSSVGDEMPKSESLEFLGFYSVLVLSAVVLGAVARMALVYHRMLTAEKFHTLLLSKVMFFPVSFFDTTPVGRIINRFSQDMSTVDELLAQSVTHVSTMSANVLTALAGIVVATKGLFIVFVAPLSYLYVKFNIYFKRSNTAIARLEAITRSPIYADFSESLNGTSTIRAYKMQGVFSARLEAFSDDNTVPALMQQLSLQWLSMRLDFIGAVILFFMGAVTAGLSPYDFISGGFLALGLSYAITLTTILKMVVRMIAQLEAHFSSVERLRHYIEKDHGLDGIKAKPKRDHDEQEQDGEEEAQVDLLVKGKCDVEMAPPATVLPHFTPPESWPANGKIEFRNVFMRYRDCSECVLRGVSFTVDSLAKIGICGRTGCGKSSLMVALFRIEELAAGQILIDDVDISRLSVHFLRSKLAIIPQEPVLFSASLRFNLDPFEESSDEQIWEVLRYVNMEAYVNSSLPLKLEEVVSEGGDNFSTGQRQLICIGRAMLRKPKILVMDEATASIDHETDEMIQKMIRVKFQDCTVLTIAHRLNTIIDSTRVLVMNEGKNVEYDSPEVLLGTASGAFKGLWEKHLEATKQ